MTNEYVNNEDNMETSTQKTSLRVDNELYDDESNVIHKLISVERIPLPKNGENWEVKIDDEVIFVLPGTRLTKKEKKLLKAVDGLSILLNECKVGNFSVAKIKKKLKEYLNNNDNL